MSIFFICIRKGRVSMSNFLMITDVMKTCPSHMCYHMNSSFFYILFNKLLSNYRKIIKPGTFFFNLIYKYIIYLKRHEKKYEENVSGTPLKRHALISLKKSQGVYHLLLILDAPGCPWRCKGCLF